jgi:homoserine kinase
MLNLRAEGLLGSALSGAGPSVLVFYERGYESVCERFREIWREKGHDSYILRSHIPDHGYDLMRGL